MKKHSFIVELEFADKIVSDSDIEEIGINILDSLVNNIESGNGFAPENSDTYTVSIKISNNVINSTFTKVI
jgi:hypothetical protein